VREASLREALRIGKCDVFAFVFHREQGIQHCGFLGFAWGGCADRALPPPSMTAHLHDLLVVGGGPAGAATAYWAARSGLDVVIVEKKAFPRDKTCGDGLTPRGVHQLVEMGLADSLEPFHRFA